MDANTDSYRLFCFFLGVEREFCLRQSYKIYNHLKDRDTGDRVVDSCIAYYIGTAEIFNNLSKFLSCYDGKNFFDPLDPILFTKLLLSFKKNPIRKLNEKSKSYATLKMSAVEFKI